MKYRILVSHKALADMERVGSQAADRITKKLAYFEKTSDPFRHAKQLKGELAGLYRFRIGHYRAIFEKDKKGNLVILTILSVRHRKDVYE